MSARIRQIENSCRAAVRPCLLLFVLAALLIVPRAATGGSASPAAWSPVPLPAPGQAGHWTLAPGATLSSLTRAVDGTIYACGDGPTQALFRSTDNGVSWSVVRTLTTAVVGMAASPSDPAVLYYATADTVCRSPDGGASFVTLQSAPGGSGQGNRRITSLAVTRAEGWVAAVGVADDDPGEYGGVWTMAENTGTFTWSDTAAGPLDVFAVAFSPGYPTDRMLAAAATDETDTFVMFRSGDLPWNTLAGPAALHPDTGSGSVAATGAALAFTGGGTEPPVVFAGIATGTGSGDVYRVNAGTGAATDLDAGSAGGLPDLDIAALGVAGGGAQTTVLAGSSGGTIVYTSRDAGLTWAASLKSPSGTSVTSLLAAPDGPAAPPLLAATAGTGSGLSRSMDAGLTWDQAGFINTSIDAIVDLAPSPRYGADGTLFLLTFGGGVSSLWRTYNEGAAWERVLSTGSVGATTLDRIGLPPGYGTDHHVLYTAGDSGGTPAIWLSRDDGRTFDRRPTLDPATGAPFAIDAWALAGEDTLFIAGYNGASSYVYRTDNAGFYYAPGAPAGPQPVASLAVTADGTGPAVLAGGAAGQVYLSRDSGATFQPIPPVPPTGLPAAAVSVAFDADFITNGTVYAAAAVADSGVYRFRTATGIGWDSIDTTLPASGSVQWLITGPDGVLYGADSAAGTGMERSLEPARVNPAFSTVTRGLPEGTVMHGLWQAGTSLWSADTAHDRLWRFDDTLTSPVRPDLPAADATDCGTVTDHVATGVRLTWETLPGATGYAWQCNDDDSFGTLASGMSGTTSSASASLPALRPGTTYYWRVRADTPVPSPWSATRAFTTRLDTATVGLQPDNPAPGAADVPVRPLFHWTAVAGADAYELLVAADMDFADPVIARRGDTALPTNAWVPDVSLAPGTTYYWKVRAVTAGDASVWSATGIFSTAAAATAEDAPPATTNAPETAATTASPTTTPSIQVYTPLTPPPGTQAPATTVVSPVPVTVRYEPGTLPTWLLYTIGGLLVTLIMVLAVLLVVVLKIRAR
jgi:hypothetical protein